MQSTYLLSPSIEYFGYIEYISGTRSGGGTTSNPLSSSSTMSTIVTTNSSNVVTGSSTIAGSSTEQTGFPSSTNNEESKSSHVRRRRKVCKTDNAMGMRKIRQINIRSGVLKILYTEIMLNPNFYFLAVTP